MTPPAVCFGTQGAFVSLHNPNQDTYFTTHQVAVMFGVTVATVANWVDTGKLPAHRTAGGHRRIGAEDLAAFARSQGQGVPDSLRDHARSSLRVLVVDDSRSFLESVRRALIEAEDIRVVTADTAFLAGLEMASEPPDLIVLDLMMPDIDAFDFLRLVRSRPELSEIPVVACTAFADHTVEKRAREAGFAAFLSKPLEVASLESTLREAVASNEH